MYVIEINTYLRLINDLWLLYIRVGYIREYTHTYRGYIIIYINMSK